MSDPSLRAENGTGTPSTGRTDFSCRRTGDVWGGASGFLDAMRYRDVAMREGACRTGVSSRISADHSSGVRLELRYCRQRWSAVGVIETRGNRYFIGMYFALQCEQSK